ncbi:MAG: hypothetical protein MJZ38_07655, partial [archaeon]|nr:hypothetical protein [archaeon]
MSPATSGDVPEEFRGLVINPPNGLDPEWIHEAPPHEIRPEDGSIMENLLKDDKWDEILDHLISDVAD